MFDQATATATTADNGIVTTDGRQFTVVADAPETTVTKLRGEALKVMVSQMLTTGAGQAEIARAAGWVWEGGRTDVNGMWVEFGKASAGVQVGGARKGKSPTNETGVTKAGQILVGAAYAKQVDWKQGDRVVIAVDAAAGTITLSLKQ